MQDKKPQEPVADDQRTEFERLEAFTKAIVGVRKAEIDALRLSALSALRRRNE